MNLTSITMPQGIKIAPGGYVTAAGDVNGDGHTDFLINAYYVSYLVFGEKNIDWQAPQMIEIQSATVSIDTIIGIGDVNGDGCDDILGSVPGAGNFGEGRVYLILGKKNTWDNIDLTNFNSSYGVAIRGNSYSYIVGTFIGGVSDINGDSYADFFIGTSDTVYYLVLGKKDNWSGDMILGGSSSLGVIKVEVGYNSVGSNAHSVGSAGDFNGDGYGDFFLGTFYKDSPSTGISYLICGNDTLTHMNLNNLSATYMQIEDTGNTKYSNWPLAYAGDINNDGYSDFLVSGSNFITYLVYGKHNLCTHINLANFNFSLGITIKGGENFYYSGFPMSNAGDVNNDTFDDFLLSASVTNQANRATTYLVLGREHLYNISLTSFNASQGVIIKNVYIYASLSAVGDFDNDGYDDIAIGSPDSYTLPSYLIFGGKIETPSPTIHPDHPTTSTTITPTLPTTSTTDIPTAPTAPTMPTFPTTAEPTIDPTTIAPINGTSDADSESHSESWASSPTGIGILTTAAILAAGAIVLGAWYCLCYRNRIANNKLQEGLLDNELDILQ